MLDAKGTARQSARGECEIVGTKVAVRKEKNSRGLTRISLIRRKSKSKPRIRTDFHGSLRLSILIRGDPCKSVAEFLLVLLPAGRRNDSIHAQIYCHLPIVVHDMCA
jgi:hypothetical protein